VRGYDAQDVLTTRRLSVANVEARIPLMGPVGLLSRVGALPLDAIVFGDAAAFWNGGTANLGRATGGCAAPELACASTPPDSFSK
jgi:hypothetical protein